MFDLPLHPIVVHFPIVLGALLPLLAILLWWAIKKWQWTPKVWALVSAVALVYAHSPDIVLMDIGLPQMNGIEATRHIKAVAPQVHVVILTIRESFKYKAAALKAGADRYISKLDMGTQLIPVLANLLGMTPESDKVM